MQGLDGPPGDKGDDGEAGQAVSVVYQLCYFFTALCVIPEKGITYGLCHLNCKLFHFHFMKF